MSNPTLANDIAYAISCVQDYRDSIDPHTIEDVRTIYDISMRIERLFQFYYQLTGFDPNLHNMLDAIRSAEVDELELPEINEQNKSTVESKKLPKREK